MKDSDDRQVLGQDPDDFDDNYEEDVSVSPIGRLMDDDTSEDEPSAFVSGYSRNSRDRDMEQEVDERPPLPSPVTERRPRRERPAPPPADTEDDFFETGVREARVTRDRERRRQPNPAPRPAVRATVPTQRRMAGSPAQRREIDEPDSTQEDSYDNFRQRYNPDELISSGRGSSNSGNRSSTPPPNANNPNKGEGGANRPARPAQRPPRPGGDVDLSASRGFAARRGERESDDGGDNTGIVRIVAGGIIFILLILLVIMTGSRAGINRRYRAASARITEMQETYDRASHYQARYQAASTENNQLRLSNADLQAQLTQPDAGNDTTGNGTTGAADNDTTPGNGAPDTIIATDFPRQHVVTAGQNLVRIAIIHYGSSTASENQARANFIAAYNNITNPNLLFVGAEVTIPALPDVLPE